MNTEYSDEMILAARKELKKRAARVSLANFITYTMPSYQMGWVHRVIAEALDEFLQDVADKKSPRLIITVPPRHGKSQIVSRHFPAYTLGRYPDFEFVGSSYSGELATEFSKNVQELMESPEFCEIFPDVKIPMKGVKANGATRQADKFKIIDRRGSYVSVGVSGSLTGRGAHVLVIDDPLKDRAEALSETVRNNVWNWYTSTAYTRLAPGGGVIVMCTRWSVDDLIGRLLDMQAKGEGDTWKIVNFPAIAECDELYRKEGEALHPDRYPLDALERIRKAVGERDWNSLYQQHPIPEGGGIFKKDWIRRWTPTSLPVSFDRVLMSWDMTFKDTSKSDYVVGQVWAKKGANHYLLDQVRGQWSFTKTKEMFVELCKKWPRATRKLIEDKANGPAVISEFKDVITGIVPITPEDSKEARAHAVSTLWEAGNVYIPEQSADHPWVAEFETELLTFPGGVHDDMCFAPGTKVATLSGDKPIEEIKVGDYVLTPFGYRKVLNASCTGIAETITKFGITATPNHPFIALGKGVVEFSEIHKCECSVLNFEGLLSWKYQKVLCSMELPIDSWEQSDITLVSQLQMKDGKVRKDFMLRFGNFIQERKFLKAMKFTTKTVTSLITTLATLSAYRATNTARSLVEFVQKSKKSTWKELDTWQVNGTEAMKAESGIANMQEGLKHQKSNAFACNVEKSFWQAGLMRSSAHTTADKLITTTMHRKPNWFVNTVERLLLALSGRIERKKRPVAELVQDDLPSKNGPMKVYNLTVEGVHCFYANGILVHNCDAMTQALNDFNNHSGFKVHSSNINFINNRGLLRR